MPELPEVEQFRQILLPLAQSGGGHTLLGVELTSTNGNAPPRKWLTPDDVAMISNRYHCRDVLRKGKLLCMVLEESGSTTTKKKTKKYLFLHMGMTGRLSSPNRTCRLENVADDGSVFPPSHTYLLLQMQDYQVAFSDPRKFGSAQLCDDLTMFHALAPDALETLHEQKDVSSSWTDTILPKLIHQSIGIKALLLDQKRVLSGVGNWVADEVLYQIQMHPDQNYLTHDQAHTLCITLSSILSNAVQCLKNDQEFPDTWLFLHRWTKKKAGKDSKGRPLAFITSGGRTSAIVESIQKLKKVKLSKPKAEASDDRKGSVSTSSKRKKKSIEPIHTDSNVGPTGSSTEDTASSTATSRSTNGTNDETRSNVGSNHSTNSTSKRKSTGARPESKRPSKGMRRSPRLLAT